MSSNATIRACQLTESAPRAFGLDIERREERYAIVIVAGRSGLGPRMGVGQFGESLMRSVQ